jgi:ectoine hydroxylase-related dioxygenase (phytanoyl-CoA dioxygenase family)
LTTEVITKHILDHGYFILEDAIEPTLCDDLMTEIARLEQSAVPRSLDNDFHGHRTTRFYDVLNLGDIWQKLPIHHSILPVAKAVLGEDCLLNTYGTSIINPGETRQRMHVDDGPFLGGGNERFGGGNISLIHRPRLYENGPRIPIVLNTMLALCDFTDEIGATRFVPKSNLKTYPRRSGPDEWYEHSVPAIMPRGSVLFFEGQCFHGGGANVTDQRRYAVTVDYCAGFLRTQENFILSTAKEKLRAFSDDLQQLVGLRTSRGGLGHVYHHSPDDLQQHVAMANSPIGPERK